MRAVARKRKAKITAIAVSEIMKLHHAPSGPIAGSNQSVRMRMTERGNPNAQ